MVVGAGFGVLTSASLVGMASSPFIAGLLGGASMTNAAPAAHITSPSCTNLSCSVDGSTSTDELTPMSYPVRSAELPT